MTTLDVLPDPSTMSDGELLAAIRALIDADVESARRWACDVPDCDGLPHAGWLHHHARAKQRPPDWPWRVWAMLTGRGFGKSLAAAQLVRQWAEKPDQHIAVVAKKETLVRAICFESPKSGLLAVIPRSEVKSYNSSPGNLFLTLTNGTIIRGFGAEVPDNLRGWAFDKGYADEFAAWNRHTAQATMDMLWFCLREAEEPQVVIATTPKPLPHVVNLVRRATAAAAGEEHPTWVLARGHTNENAANLSQVALDELEASYGGTRLGDQELAGELLEDVDGALWSRWMFEVDEFRLRPVNLPTLDRVVVAVDPATTTTETADETGFAVAGRGLWRPMDKTDDRPHGYVLHSEAQKLTPIQTMERAADLYRIFKADAVVIEANNGGEYLATVLEMVDATIPHRIVHATRGKRARATPVASLYEQERVHHVGSPKDFDTLETVMTTYVGAPEKDEKSPDILDALVWAMWDLFLDQATATQRPRGPEQHRRDR